MVEINTFHPRGADWDRNLADYVQAAKILPFMAISKIVWGDPVWDLTGLAKPERAGQKPTVRFEGGRLKAAPLSGSIGDFSRAYVAFKISEEFGIERQIGKFTKPIISMRALATVMTECDLIEPADITPALLDATVDRFRAADAKEYGIEQRAHALEWIVKALNTSGIARSPFEWSFGSRSFQNQSRINKFEDE